METQLGRTFIGRLSHKSDVLGELTRVCRKENIRLGTFTVIGAVTRAMMGYYLQDEKRYTECASFEEKLEIASCVGNVSLNNGEPFVHAHITLADHGGKCYGGHLMPGTEIFAAEYHIQELAGAELRRADDTETGLRLWQERSE